MALAGVLPDCGVQLLCSVEWSCPYTAVVSCTDHKHQHFEQNTETLHQGLQVKHLASVFKIFKQGPCWVSFTVHKFTTSRDLNFPLTVGNHVTWLLVNPVRYFQKWLLLHSSPCFFSQLTAQPKTSWTSFPSSVTSFISPMRFTSGRWSSDTWWPSTCLGIERWVLKWIKFTGEAKKKQQSFLRRDSTPTCSSGSFSSCWP